MSLLLRLPGPLVVALVLPLLIAAAAVPAPAPSVPAGPVPVAGWRLPVDPPTRVVRGFDLGPDPWSPGHRGVDLLAAAGTAVHAPAAGVVSFAGVVAGRGVLSIDHGGGLVSSFEPVSGAPDRGSVVASGAVVGRTDDGPGHCAPLECLHWGVRAAGRYIDPLSLVAGRAGPAVLLPLAGFGPP